MADRVDKPSTSDPQEKSRKLTRRDMIKGVIAAGAVCSTGYLVRSAFHQTSAASPGSVERLIMLNVNGQQRAVDVMKQETLARRCATSWASPAPSWVATAPNAAPAPC